MTDNITKSKEKPEYNNTNKNKNNCSTIQTGKIMEKLIIINKDKINAKDTKIQENKTVKNDLEINENILRKNKSEGIFKRLKQAKKKENKGPYSKPKCQNKNKNSFSIKNPNKKNNANEEIKNIYLNFFKVYYDENGNKVKIINNKSNYKENKSKELLLTQNNIESYNSWVNKRNNVIKNNYITEFLDIKKNNNINNSNKESTIDIIYLNPETPTQSTTTENKSYIKTGTIKNKDEILPCNDSIKIDFLDKKENNEKNNKIPNNNAYYNSLPQFLKIRKNQKNKDKYKKKNIDKKVVLNNTVKFNLFEESKKKKSNNNINNTNNGLLISKLKNNKSEIKINNSKNNNSKAGSPTVNKVNNINNIYNTKSNSSINAELDQNTTNNSHTINAEKSNIKKIYISSFKKKKNLKKNLRNSNYYFNNNFEKINFDNTTLNPRSTLRIQGNNILFNAFKENNNNQDLFSNYNFNSNISYSLSPVRNNTNLSFNKNTIFDNNYLNYTISFNDFNVKNNNINILNKTKDIINIQNRNVNINNSIIKKDLLTHSSSLFDYFPESYFKTNTNSLENTYNNTNNFNEIMNNIQNIDSYDNFKNQEEKNNKRNNIDIFNKIRRPCSLYINKKLNKKDNKHQNIKINKNSCFRLNNYYKDAIGKDSHLNKNINSIYKKTQNLGENIQLKSSLKYKKKENEVINNYKDNLENGTVKRNLNDIKFINLNGNNTPCQLINKRIERNNNILKNKNKGLNGLHSNSSLNYIPSSIKINKNYNIDYYIN